MKRTINDEESNPRLCREPRTASVGNAYTSHSRRSIAATIDSHNNPTLEIQLPGGARLGEIRRDEGTLVWERSVEGKHVLRMMDAYTINRPILAQLLRLDVDLVRYCAPEGRYEIPLDVFVTTSKRLPGFANGEDVHALARSSWLFEPADRLLGLFDDSSEL